MGRVAKSALDGVVVGPDSTVSCQALGAVRFLRRAAWRQPAPPRGSPALRRRRRAAAARGPSGSSPSSPSRRPAPPGPRSRTVAASGSGRKSVWWKAFTPSIFHCSAAPAQLWVEGAASMRSPDCSTRPGTRTARLLVAARSSEAVAWVPEAFISAVGVPPCPREAQAEAQSAVPSSRHPRRDRVHRPRVDTRSSWRDRASRPHLLVSVPERRSLARQDRLPPLLSDDVEAERPRSSAMARPSKVMARLKRGSRIAATKLRVLGPVAGEPGDALAQ